MSRPGEEGIGRTTEAGGRPHSGLHGQIRLGERGGQRLFGVDVLAAGQGRDGDSAMSKWRRDIDDQLDSAVFQKLFGRPISLETV